MSVQSEIDRISSGVANTYSVLEGMGATMPETRNIENLPSTASTVPGGSVSGSGLPEVTTEDNGKHLEVVDGVWSVVEQGDDLERITILEETTIELVDSEGSVIGVTPDVIAGESYVVVYDGVEYTCEAFSLMGMIALGNGGPIGAAEDTGEPFIIGIAPGEGYFVASYTENDTCTLAIYYYEEPKTSWNDLSDRPFGEKITKSIIIPEMSINCQLTTLFGSTKAYSINGAGYDTFTVGDTIEVILEGNEYVCTAIEVQGLPCVGDSTLLGGSSNGEPFLVGCNPEDGTLMIYIFIVEDETVTTKEFFGSITKLDVTVNKIDEKYIPNSAKLPSVTEEDNGKHLEVVDGVWTVVEQSGSSEESENCLPEVTEEDEGKFLSVVGGVWSLVSLTNGNEVAY